MDLLTQHETLGRCCSIRRCPRRESAPRSSSCSSTCTDLPCSRKLLVLLAERDRLVLLPEVLAAYRQRLLDHQNVVRAEITTATPLSADATQAIERDLAQATGRRVTLAAHVDPSIIGGIVARIGSTVYDGSITGQLQRMKERLDTHGH